MNFVVYALIFLVYQVTFAIVIYGGVFYVDGAFGYFTDGASYVHNR